MSQDVISDTLNQMMNAKRARKNTVVVQRHSKMLLSILAIAKLKGYVAEYEVKPGGLTITLGKLNKCNAIKPRFMASVADIDHYLKRYLPAKDLGVVIISTNQGLMTHQTALEKNIGGSLIAYFF